MSESVGRPKLGRSMAGGSTILELKHHVLNGRLAQARQRHEVLELHAPFEGEEVDSSLADFTGGAGAQILEQRCALCVVEFAVLRRDAVGMHGRMWPTRMETRPGPEQQKLGKLASFPAA